MDAGPLERAIQDFESLASQTYEGRPVVAALGLTGSMGHGRIKLEELWREDFSRVLSNGFDSMYLCGSDSRVFNLAYLPAPQSIQYAPHRLGSIADWCHLAQRVALVLNRNGEILMFKDRRLQFAKRRGAWRYYAHDSVVRRLGVGDAALRRAVYESCLDVSFARDRWLYRGSHNGWQFKSLESNRQQRPCRQSGPTAHEASRARN